MPSFLDLFNWDAEDLARAGDKKAHSPDDKECGDHFIPKWKDCHDGDAHRPEPGENPYWTDENSAEERTKRGVPWDTNKPKSKEEREKETDWEPPEEPPEEIEPEEYAPEDEEPEQFEDDEPLVPEDFEDPPPPTDEDVDRWEREEFDRDLVPEEEWRHGEEWPYEEYLKDRESEWKEKQRQKQREADKQKLQDMDTYRESQRQAAVDKWAAKDAARQQRQETLQPRELSPEANKGYAKKMRNHIEKLQRMAMMAYTGNIEVPGSKKITPGERAAEWLEINDNLKSWAQFNPQDQQGVETLARVLRDTLQKVDIGAGEEMREGVVKTLMGGPINFQKFGVELAQMENLLDQFENDKFAYSDPQDILNWEKLKSSPEYMSSQNSLKSITEIPGFRLKGIDPNNMSPQEEEYAANKLRSLELWFSQWKHNPSSGMGGYLAKKLLGSAEQMGPHIDESPVEPNPEAARIIAEISARAGEANANDIMWEDFGVSEEWTAQSFVHDYKKAAKKAVKAAKKELGFDIAAWQKEFRVLDKMEREAKAFDKKNKPRTKALLQERLAVQKQFRAGQIDEVWYNREKERIKDEIAIMSNQARDREIAMEEVRSRLRPAIEEARLALHESLTQANAQNAALPETIEAIAGRAERPEWRDMGNDRPPRNKDGETTPKMMAEWEELQASRRSAREAYDTPYFVQARGIQMTMQRVLGWLHRDLLEGPEGVMLKELNWQAESSFRAHANERDNSIVLDQYTYPNVAAHEFGHHLEFRNKRVKGRIMDFYNERTEGVEAEWVEGYESHERFKQPRQKSKRFFTDYAAKFYEGTDGEQHDTELLSLGLEALEDKDKFRQILRHDPEHLAIILATIRGY